MKFSEHCYKCKARLIPGHNFKDVNKIARRIYNGLNPKSKRRPHIKSAYFGCKVFLDNYWPHLKQKSPGDQIRRLKFFECALELIQNSKGKPVYQQKDELKKEALYRFIGKVGAQYFIVQIKEDLKRKQKYLMSAFSYEI